MVKNFLGKKGSVDWTIGQLLSIVLGIFLIVLVIYGVVTGGLVPLGDKIADRAESVLILLGFEEDPAVRLECLTRQAIERKDGDILESNLEFLGESLGEANWTTCATGQCLLEGKSVGKWDLRNSEIYGGVTWDTLHNLEEDSEIIISPGLTERELLESYFAFIGDSFDKGVPTSVRTTGGGNVQDPSVFARRTWVQYLESSQYRLGDSASVSLFYWELYNKGINHITQSPKAQGIYLGSGTSYFKLFGDDGGDDEDLFAVWKDNSWRIVKGKDYLDPNAEVIFSEQEADKKVNSAAIYNIYLETTFKDLNDDEVYYEFGSKDLTFDFEQRNGKGDSWKDIGDLIGGNDELEEEEQLEFLEKFEEIREQLLEEQSDFSKETILQLEELLSGSIEIRGEQYEISMTLLDEKPLLVLASEFETYGLLFTGSSEENIESKFALMRELAGEYQEVGFKEDYRKKLNDFERAYKVMSIYEFLKVQCG